MLVVVADDCRALNLHLLIVDSPTLPFLPPLGHLLLDGFVAGGDHRDEPNVIPQDAKKSFLRRHSVSPFGSRRGFWPTSLRTVGVPRTNRRVQLQWMPASYNSWARAMEL